MHDIRNLRELNDAVNSVVNYIVATACEQTSDGNFTISLDDIDLDELSVVMTYDDMYQYDHFIEDELRRRPELEDVDYADHTFSLECCREFCPNLEDRSAGEPLKRPSQPLSLSETAEIGSRAIQALSGKNLSGLRETLGMSFEQIYGAGLTDQDHFFSIYFNGDIRKPEWFDNITDAGMKMSAYCKAGLQPSLYFNAMVDVNHTQMLPLAKAVNDSMVTVPLSEHPEASKLQSSPNFEKALQHTEATTYGFSPRYGLSYSVVDPITQRGINAFTLKDAMLKFNALPDQEHKRFLVTVKAHSKTQLPSFYTALEYKNGKIAFAPCKTIMPQPMEKLEAAIVSAAFPGKELDIDRWKVRLIEQGDRYGRGNQLILDDVKPRVEFRDMKYITKDAPDGIVAARYFLESLTGSESGRTNQRYPQGLMLDGQVPEWHIPSELMNTISTWLCQKETEIEKSRPVGLSDKILNAQARAEQQAKGEPQTPQKDLEH